MSDKEKRQAERDYLKDPSKDNAIKMLRKKLHSGEAVGGKLYGVVATVYDYNDEYFYTIEGDPYNVHKLYVNKESADRDCQERNCDEFLTSDLTDWLSHEEGLFSVDNIDNMTIPQFLAQFGISYDPNVDPDEDPDPNIVRDHIKTAFEEEKITQETLNKIYAATPFNFYRVIEFSVEDGICGEL